MSVLSCDAARERFDEPDERLETHLMGCAGCRHAHEGWVALEASLAAMPPLRAPADLHASVMAALPAAPLAMELPRWDWSENTTWALAAAIAGWGIMQGLKGVPSALGVWRDTSLLDQLIASPWSPVLSYAVLGLGLTYVLSIPAGREHIRPF